MKIGSIAISISICALLLLACLAAYGMTVNRGLAPYTRQVEEQYATQLNYLNEFAENYDQYFVRGTVDKNSGTYFDARPRFDVPGVIAVGVRGVHSTGTASIHIQDITDSSIQKWFVKRPGVNVGTGEVQLRGGRTADAIDYSKSFRNANGRLVEYYIIVQLSHLDPGAPSQRKRTAPNDTTERKDQTQLTPDADPKDVGNEEMTEAPKADD